VYLSDLECYIVRNLAKLPPFVNIILHLKQFYGTFRKNYLITLLDTKRKTTMIRKMLPALVLPIALVVISCASLDTRVADLPDLLLREPQTRHYYGGTVTFPKGTYTPIFKTSGGIYYAAPRQLVIASINKWPQTGGIFIPFDKTAAQGWWMEGHLIPTRYIKINDPVILEEKGVQP
jgi:hypothetical protein